MMKKELKSKSPRNEYCGGGEGECEGIFGTQRQKEAIFA